MAQQSSQALKARIYPAYGSASLGKVAVEVTLQLYLFDFYTRILGLSPLLAGTAFAIAILWDGLSDLIVSAALFKARARGLPYTLIFWLGGLVLAATTVLLFNPFRPDDGLSLFLHLLITYVLVNTGMTLLDLPQTSLSAELSQRADERNKLLASRMGFGIFGLSVGSILPGLLLATSGDRSELARLADSRGDAAWMLAMIVLATASYSALGLRSRERIVKTPTPPEIPSLAEVAGLLKDQPYVYLLIAGIVAAVGRTMNAALALMYYRFVLELSEEQVTRMIFPVFTLSIVLSIPLWIGLSKRFGKKVPAYWAVVGLGVMGIIAYPILPAGQISPPLLISVVGGILCGAVFLVDSMITDCIDTDEKSTGKRKESLYFAVWKSGLKFARAGAFVIIGIGLQRVGLDQAQESVSDSVRLGIILIFGVAVGICFVVSGLLIRWAKVPKPLT